MADGSKGERIAAWYLERQGFRVVARNYRIRQGEIDLVAENDTYLLFVEVKTRKADAWLRGEDAVDTHKQTRLRAAAAHYLAQSDFDAVPGQASEKQPRFDVICIEALPEGRWGIRWYRDAFQ